MATGDNGDAMQAKTRDDLARERHGLAAGSHWLNSTNYKQGIYQNLLEITTEARVRVTERTEGTRGRRSSPPSSRATRK